MVHGFQGAGFQGFVYLNINLGTLLQVIIFAKSVPGNKIGVASSSLTNIVEA